VGKKSKSVGSLQDQLKNAGLVTGKQTRKAQKGIHRQDMRVKQGQDIDKHKVSAEQTLAEKRVRDREENKKLHLKAQNRALNAQIRQLIDMNRQRQDGEHSYNFSDNKKIKKIYVSESNKQQLNNGILAIVKIGTGYELVPEQVARRIMARITDRKNEVVLFLYDKSTEVVDEDDPYKDFPIPDDLDW